MTKQSATYLILHSPFDGALDKPWQVIRCYRANCQQVTLFDGPRDEAKAYLAAHWDAEAMRAAQ